MFKKVQLLRIHGRKTAFSRPSAAGCWNCLGHFPDNRSPGLFVGQFEFFLLDQLVEQIMMALAPALTAVSRCFFARASPWSIPTSSMEVLPWFSNVLFRLFRYDLVPSSRLTSVWSGTSNACWALQQRLENLFVEFLLDGACS